MKILFTAVLAFITSITFAQDMNIFVAVAHITPDPKCSSTDLPEYKVVSGTIAGTSLGRQAKEALQEKYGEKYKNAGLYIELSNNSSANENFLTILSATISDHGCKRFKYGIGFGKNKQESLKKAEIHLNSIASNFGKKISYKIVKQEEITEEISGSGENEDEQGQDKEQSGEKELDKLKHKS